MLTPEMLLKVCPRARHDIVDALVTRTDILEKAGITTPVRMAQFLANVAHESSGLVGGRENMNYSAQRIKEVWPTRPEAVKFARDPVGLANCVYNGRMGNRPGTDDGYDYRGGGLIQTTGREHYEILARETGTDLLNHPELIDDAVVSLVAATWEFSKYVELCDRGDVGFRAVCNGINRGNVASKYDPIGWLDRQRWLARWTDALGARVAPDDTIRLGDHGALVTAFQQRLIELRYPVGRVDGIFGSRVRAAVLAFQAENGLATDGIVGPVTRAALNSEAAKPMPLGDRANETVQDLKDAGSSTIATTQTLKTAAKAAIGVSLGVGGAQQAVPTPSAPPVDLIQGTKNVVTEIGSWKSVVTAIGDTAAWVTSHWWIFAIVAAFATYRYANKAELTRLRDHILGFNLGR